MESVGSGIGSAVDKFRFVVASKGPSQVLGRLMEVWDRFGLFTVEKSKSFSNKFIELANGCGITPTITLSAGHLSEYPDLAKFFREAAQEKRVNLGSHGWVHEAPSLESEQAQKEIVLGSKNLLKSCDIDPTGWRAPRYINYPGTVDGTLKAKYKWDATYTVLFLLEEFDALTPQQRTNFNRSLNLSPFRYISEQLAVPQIYSSQEGSIVRLLTGRPDDQELQNVLLLNGSEAKKQRATDIMLQMVEFAHDNMELFVQQFHPERIDTYYNQLKACFEKIIRISNVLLFTPDQMADWCIERENVTLSLEKKDSNQVVVVHGPARGRAILINPNLRPSDQTQVRGFREIGLSDGHYPGIGLQGTVENIERVKKLLNDFLSEPFQADKNYACVINTDNASDKDLVAAIRGIISGGNVNYPLVMRSRYPPINPEAPDGPVYTWAYLLIGDICQFNLEKAVMDTLWQKAEIERARRYARSGVS